MFRRFIRKKGGGNKGRKRHVPREKYVDEHSAVCFSFGQAVEALEESFYKNSLLFLTGVSEAERDPAEVEASLKFSDCLIDNTNVTSLVFKDLELTLDLVQAVKKAVSTDKTIVDMRFDKVTCKNIEAGNILRDSLLEREAGRMLFLRQDGGDGRIFQSLIEATAVAGASITFDSVNLNGLNVSRCLRRWTLKSTELTKVEFSDIEGLSPVDELMMMKGFRNFVNMTTLILKNVLSKPERSIMLCESLAFILHQSSRFRLDIGQDKVGISEASLLKITQLVEGFSIFSLKLEGVRTSLGKRLISTKILSEPDTIFLAFHHVIFSDEKDFQLMYFGLKQRQTGVKMYLSNDSFTDEQQRKLSLLQPDENIVFQ